MTILEEIELVVRRTAVALRREGNAQGADAMQALAKEILLKIKEKQ